MFFCSRLKPVVVMGLMGGVILASALGWGSVMQFASLRRVMLYAGAVLLGDV